MATHSQWPLAPATTNARGEWEISGIPPNHKMVGVATHAKTSVGWAIVGEWESPLDEAVHQPRVFDKVGVRVKPLFSSFNP
jgi:hypothetical protein